MSIFNFNPEVSNDISTVAIIACKCDDAWVLVDIGKSRKIYIESAFCRRNSGMLTDVQLAPYNQYNLELKSSQLVVAIPEEYWYIDPTINTMDEFYQWVVFADKYGLDVERAVKLPQYANWWYAIKAQQKKRWSKSRILKCHEMTTFLQPKLADSKKSVLVCSIGPMQPYKIGLPPITQEKFNTLIQMLNGKFVYELLIIFATSIDLCHLVVQSHIIEKISPAILYYTLRILYSDELLYLPRAIIPLEAVSTLEYITDETLINPYFLSRVEIYYSSNYIDGNRKILSGSTFIARLELATHGLLDCVIYGRLVCAAAAYSPLEQNMGESFSKYLDTYYESVEIDIMTQNLAATLSAITAKYPNLIVSKDSDGTCRFKGLERDILVHEVDDIPLAIADLPFACDRIWYDKTSAWCYPSFISAALTGINIDIKPTTRESILAYMKRGFVSLLNKNDQCMLGVPCYRFEYDGNEYSYPFDDPDIELYW